MEPEGPLDLISEATDSLGAVCDLLNWGWSSDINKRDLHQVDSERLGILLGRCERDLRAALKDLYAREQLAAQQRAGRA